MDVQRRAGQRRRTSNAQSDDEFDKAVRRELERVGYQVVDDLEELYLVHQYKRLARRRQIKAGTQIDPLGSRGRHVQVGNGATDIDDVDSADVDVRAGMRRLGV